MLRRGCGEADRVAGRARRAGRAAPGSGPRRAVGPLLGRADRAAGPDPGRADPGLGAVPRRGDAVRGGDQPAAARGGDSAGNADRRRRRRRGRRGPGRDRWRSLGAGGLVADDSYIAPGDSFLTDTPNPGVVAARTASSLSISVSMLSKLTLP